jgi:adenosylmethionine-8-amino-7-oxononanoate aminotransferase
VILEPLIQGAAGMRMVRPQFLQAVAERVQASGALLIADEVMTGFGRSGSLFAFLQAGIQPDLIALSKGLTGGFLPMGATLAAERIYQGFIAEQPGVAFLHGHSFTANPLGCAAALASLDLLLEQPQRFEGFQARHQHGLEALAEEPGVVRIRCQGSVAAFELEQGSSGYLNPVGLEIQRHCLEQGVFLRPLGNVVYLLPPLSISDAQLGQCYEAIRNAVQHCAA